MWTALLKEVISKFILKTVAGMTGFKAWIVKKAMEYGGQLLVDFVSSFIKKLQRKAEQEQAKENYEKVDQDPNSKVEERAKAYEDLINSGK